MIMAKLSLYDDGYIWVRQDQIKLIRTDYNSQPWQERDYCFIQLLDGLEYKLSHTPDKVLGTLGLA